MNILRLLHNAPRRLIREVRFLYQRLTRGFDDSVTWSLDVSLAKLILPRLRLFRSHEFGTPGSYITGEDYKLAEEDHARWLADLDKMIAAFEFTVNDQFDKGEMKEHQEGLNLFAKHFWSLWE